MEFTPTYIASQVATIIMYVLLAITYYAKNRKTVLTISFLSLIANIIAYVLLRAWTGMAMCVFALFRNIWFLIDEAKNGKKETISKRDIWTLVFLYVLIIVATVPAFEGFLSLLSVFATSIYTYSVWQKKTLVYKFCGIPVGILWILYNIYVQSLFGIILESILLICSITGYILEAKKKKVTN